MDLVSRLAEHESQRDGFTVTIAIPLADGTFKHILEETRICNPLVVHAFADDDVVTSKDVRDVVKRVKKSIRHTVDGDEIFMTYTDSSVSSTTVPGTDEVLGWSSRQVCHCNKRASKPRTAKAAPITPVVVPDKLGFLNTLKTADSFTPAQTTAVSTAQASLADLIGAGRVRGSNCYKLCTVIAQRLEQCKCTKYITNIQHMHKPGLLRELKRLAPTKRGKSTWKKKTLYDAVSRARKKAKFTTQSIDIVEAATDIIGTMSDNVTNGITKQLRHVLFRSKSDRPPSAACKRGIDAEPILLGRILKKGLSVYDPLTKTRVHATLRNEEFQTLLIPGDNATIAATTDMTGRFHTGRATMHMSNRCRG